MLLNGPLSVRAARQFSGKIIREAGATPRQRITYAFEAALSRNPTVSECAQSEQFLETQERLLAEVNDPRASLLALAEFCKILLAGNEFLQLQ